MIAIISGRGEIGNLLKKRIKDAILIKIPSILDVNEIINILKNKGIKRVIFAGKFEKGLIYKHNEQFLKKDDLSIIKDIKKRFENSGIKVLNPKRWLSFYIAKKGLLAGRLPNDIELNDIKEGLRIVKILNRFGTQVICIKDGIVIAMEGLEGTDEVIKRAGKITNAFVIVKYGKVGLEMPVVGEKTIRVMKRAGARVLAIRSNVVLVLPKAAELAEKSNISLIGI